MLREIGHFLRHAPRVARLSRRMSQADLFDLLAHRADASGYTEWRAALVGDLEGRVLEIGCGTGRMFRHYPAGVELIGTEPAESFLERAREPAARAAATVTLETASAEDLPFDDDSFDYVVLASVLCSVTSVGESLAEIRRVLKPGGEARLIEHIKSERFFPGLLMEVFNPLWRLWNGQGCNMNRRTDRSLREAGFQLQEVRPFQLFSPGLPAFPSLWIRARYAAETDAPGIVS